MAVPKKRTSPSRKGMRRSHHTLSLPTVVKCPRCGAARHRHTVCRECGYYRGRSIFQIEEA